MSSEWLAKRHNSSSPVFSQRPAAWKIDAEKTDFLSILPLKEAACTWKRYCVDMIKEISIKGLAR